MIHRYLLNMALFDALFLAALATAAYIHVGYAWLLYVICIAASVVVFRTLKDISSWFDLIAEQINFLARCIRDHD